LNLNPSLRITSPKWLDSLVSGFTINDIPLVLLTRISASQSELRM